MPSATSSTVSPFELVAPSAVLSKPTSSSVFAAPGQTTQVLQESISCALRALVKPIYIDAPDKSSGKRQQSIRISYDLVDFIPVNELTKEETA